MTVAPQVVLEAAAQDLAEATAKPPFLYDLGPDGTRDALGTA
jgi:acetyl esterase